VAWPRPHTWRSQIYSPWSFLHNSLVLVHHPRKWCTSMSPPGMRPKNHPQSQRNVLRASHLQLKTKGETEQMTQHWG
jgi:hypothetical protein